MYNFFRIYLLEQTAKSQFFESTKIGFFFEHKVISGKFYQAITHISCFGRLIFYILGGLMKLKEFNGYFINLFLFIVDDDFLSDNLTIKRKKALLYE